MFEIDPSANRMHKKGEEAGVKISIHEAISCGGASLNQSSNYQFENSKSRKDQERKCSSKIMKKALFVMLSVFAVAVIASLGTASRESEARTLTSTVMPSTPRPVSTNVMEIEGELSPKDYSALDGRFRVPTFKRDNGESVPIKSYKSLVGIVHGFEIENKQRVPTQRSLSEKSQPIPFSVPNFDDYDDWDAEYVFSPVTY